MTAGLGASRFKASHSLWPEPAAHNPLLGSALFSARQRPQPRTSGLMYTHAWPRGSVGRYTASGRVCVSMSTNSMNVVALSTSKTCVQSHLLCERASMSELLLSSKIFWYTVIFLKCSKSLHYTLHTLNAYWWSEIRSAIKVLNMFVKNILLKSQIPRLRWWRKTDVDVGCVNVWWVMSSQINTTFAAPARKKSSALGLAGSASRLWIQFSFVTSCF